MYNRYLSLKILKYANATFDAIGGIKGSIRDQDDFFRIFYFYNFWEHMSYF